MKYIDIKVELNKTIVINEDDLDKAIEKAEEYFCENELEPEFLDCRNVYFSENTSIKNDAEFVAEELNRDYQDKKELDISAIDTKIMSIIHNIDDYDYILYETKKILSKKFEIIDRKINL